MQISCHYPNAKTKLVNLFTIFSHPFAIGSQWLCKCTLNTDAHVSSRIWWSPSMNVRSRRSCQRKILQSCSPFQLGYLCGVFHVPQCCQLLSASAKPGAPVSRLRLTRCFSGTRCSFAYLTLWNWQQMAPWTCSTCDYFCFLIKRN